MRGRLKNKMLRINKIMASATKSSYLQIYDEETKAADYKFEVKNAQAKVSFTDSYLTRPLEFAAGAYKFKYGATLSDTFDLKDKLDEIEADVDALEADPRADTNAQAIADEAVARASADTALQNSLTAEISRATTAEQTNAAAIAALDTASQAADAVLTQAVADAESAAAAAVASEAARAQAAEASLSTQISSLLSNVDPGLIDSISELLSHVSSEDASILASLATLQSDFDDLKARFDELVNSS